MFKIFHLLKYFSFLLLISCEYFTISPDSDNQLNNFQNNHYEINILDYFNLPYTSLHVTSLDINYSCDSLGIPLFHYQGKDYYHPVNIAQKIFPLLNSYVITNDSLYLQRAELFTKLLIDSSHLYYGARFFPYQFDYQMHANELIILNKPWYSGMAQGHILTVLSRLFQYTQNPKYAQWANETFNSFYRYCKIHNPWIIYQDQNQFLWIEEYPMTSPDHTLNGFIFAIYGLYDYYLTFHYNNCLKLLQQSITTIHHYMEMFRYPDGISYYCLKHKHQDSIYHTIHINQLNFLYRLTEELDFKIMADSLYVDYP